MKKKKFEIIPAIDIMGGRCVQLRQGKKEDMIFSVENPVEIARKWVEEGARRIHIIDLDGAFQEKRTNFRLIKDIAETKVVKEKVNIQVGGGIRSHETAIKFLEIGVDRIIFGTAALKLPHLIERVAKEFSPERVMVALDARRGKIAIDGWREVTELEAKEVAKETERMGAGSLLFTNIDVEGLTKGIEMKRIEEIVDSVNLPVVVSGGVSSIEDIKGIKESGASGVVIGSALYMGKIDFKDLLRTFQN